MRNITYSPWSFDEEGHFMPAHIKDAKGKIVAFDQFVWVKTEGFPEFQQFQVNIHHDDREMKTIDVAATSKRYAKMLVECMHEHGWQPSARKFEVKVLVSK